MDNYPEHLAPAFEESGAVKTPFLEWWARVQSSFRNVPENVAKHWLHEHWGHSPFRYLPSNGYRFDLVEWPTERLVEIRSGWCEFEEGSRGCLEHGRFLVEQYPREVGRPYKTVSYMLDHGDFPAPIIVLDNADGHLKPGRPPVPAYHRLPAAHVLVEGHRRFDIALYLHATGDLPDLVSVWLMRRYASSPPAEKG